MGTMNRKDQITRRGFLELSSAAFATAGLLPDATASQAVPDPGNRVDADKDSGRVVGNAEVSQPVRRPFAYGP